jgi:hypothetical protein
MWKAGVRVTLALLGAGLFFLAWLALFLLTRDVVHPALHALRWLLGPAVTAVGFTAGLALGERITRVQTTRFWRILLWPLAGCALGAGAVYWFGPMLIVFGMFAGGTASVVLREGVRYVQGKTTPQT